MGRYPPRNQEPDLGRRIPEFRVEHRLTLRMASLAIGQGPGLRFRTLTRRMQGPVIRWTGGLAEDFREYN